MCAQVCFEQGSYTPGDGEGILRNKIVNNIHVITSIVLSPWLFPVPVVYFFSLNND